PSSGTARPPRRRPSETRPDPGRAADARGGVGPGDRPAGRAGDGPRAAADVRAEADERHGRLAATAAAAGAGAGGLRPRPVRDDPPGLHAGHAGGRGVSEPTDVLAGGAVRLWRGDCLRVLSSLPDGCVDAVVTDPPYSSG